MSSPEPDPVPLVIPVAGDTLLVSAMNPPELAPVDSSAVSAATAKSTVVTPDVLHSTSKGDDASKTILPPSKIRMQDLLRVIERDDRFHEVTVEQIERVKVMHDRFMDGVRPDFNYNTLLLVASVLAGLGLASNSTATIIASMLGKIR